MPVGDKSKYTDKQKRQAEHIEESYEKQGVSEDEAEKRAWATVNKQDGGGNLSGSGRKNSASSAKSPSIKKSSKDSKDASERDSSATNKSTRKK
ncbi:MAG TPA: type II toxin-antitoxin system RelE/ParE family toxin [Pyrinomonadaceae bacterium]|nr:type II toxin-antitoxin system RelE/ParE family toxin [Pyrinomonadaceae bacterium]